MLALRRGRGHTFFAGDILDVEDQDDCLNSLRITGDAEMYNPPYVRAAPIPDAGKAIKTPSKVYRAPRRPPPVPRIRDWLSIKPSVAPIIIVS